MKSRLPIPNPLFPLLCVVLLGWAGPARARTFSTGDEIIQAAVQAQSTKTNNAAGEFRYTRVTLTEELDASGKVKERKEKIYEVSHREGQSRGKLVSVNGRAPAASDRGAKSENEFNLQQLLGQAKASNNHSNNLLTPELTARYNFKLIGEVVINERRTFQLEFQPKKPELPAKNLIERLLNRVRGTLWIDAEELEVAQAQIVLQSEINVFGGIAGTLRNLAFTLVRTRVEEGLWLDTLSNGDIRGRKLLDSMHIKTKSELQNFRSIDG